MFSTNYLVQNLTAAMFTQSMPAQLKLNGILNVAAQGASYLRRPIYFTLQWMNGLFPGNLLLILQIFFLLDLEFNVGSNETDRKYRKADKETNYLLARICVVFPWLSHVGFQEI